jgi:phosphoglycolate phosphatase-like HAD superfamily hydrolase
MQSKFSLDHYKVICFDFDGVIVESIDVKTQAFQQIYQEYGQDVVDKVTRHHALNGGLSRFEKFKYYHLAFLGKQLTESEVNELAATFSTLVERRVAESGLVPGVIAFLEEQVTKRPLYIISATPEEELKRIVATKQLTHYFKGVFGAPKNKADVIANILKWENVSASNVLMIGDAAVDYEAAFVNQADFLARSTANNVSVFPAGTKRISDFMELMDK